MRHVKDYVERLNRGAGPVWWKWKTLTRSWWVQRHEPHCSLSSALPLPSPTSRSPSSSSPLLPTCIPQHPCVAHARPLHDLKSHCLSDYVRLAPLSLSLCQRLCVLLCLFAIRVKTGREWSLRLREEKNQPIVMGWNDGHYCCMMANYSLIRIGAVDRISKYKQSAASLMTVYSECFSFSQRLLSQKAQSVNLTQQLPAQGRYMLVSLSLWNWQFKVKVGAEKSE